MNVLYIVIGFAVFLLLLLILFVLILVAVQSQLKNPAYKELQKLRTLIPKNKKKRSWVQFTSELYPYLAKVPFVRGFLLRIRRRLAALYAEDRILLDIHTAVTAVSSLAVVIGIMLLALLFTSSWTVRLAISLAALYMGGVMADLMIGQREKKLLYGFSSMLLELRHEYHQTHMVVESLERVADRIEPQVAVHARQIAEVLSAVDPEEELRKYYDIAPNRYAKLLAGISYSVMENGDVGQKQGEQSLFLNALGRINEEIRMDILRRERLDAQLAGIVFVTFSPLFFIEPLRNWGEGSFPIMGEYYASRAGIYSLIALYLLVMGAFFGLRLIRGFDGGNVIQEGSSDTWTSRLLSWLWVRWLIDRITPGVEEPAYFRTITRLKEASSGSSIKELYLMKLAAGIIVFVAVVVVQHYVHDSIREYIRHPKVQTTTGVDAREKARANEQAKFEAKLIEEIMEANMTETELDSWISSKTKGQSFLPIMQALEKYNQSLKKKVMTYRDEYYKWYELGIAFLLAIFSYHMPNFMLWFRRSMRKWEMQNEVDGFTAIVSMLSSIPRISVKEMLDWMHRYSIIFEPQLLRCVIDYEAGPSYALDNLRDETKFQPLERIIDRLQVAADLIPVKKAFEDIEQERIFELEQRKLKYEQMIKRKVSIGKFVGFLPLHATFALYLMIPFGYMAFQQLGELSSVTNNI
ncbi:hypothetical protein [Paenibacillus puerhi]|uniref:hypothetical protein n=1 Tax=Paenibacillus puerhi TaxID=2692622 RepID=UPI0013569D45|nr:hypothetical protein [Paenibacillus puerhi]